ncbi:cyanophycin synthetase [Longitalea arenae]|uniref:cyanophycin synthetase n=1 Tax=Longitalea arenae TaxID=2812558 RepID=UPI00196774DF|nr:cyanophycin synthetase [Longitalea arenae]
MKILDLKVLMGPNFWSIRKTKLIQMVLDLQELEHWPTDKIPGFYERIKQLIPSLYNHHCSEGKPGGFFDRVRDGTWMGHVIEHIVLELQSLAGMNTGFGRTRGTGVPGVYNVVFAYGEAKSGLYAAQAAVNIAEALVQGQPYDVNEDIRQIRELWFGQKLGPTTESLVCEALKRDIPMIRLDDSSYVQLGYGAKQKRVETAVTNHTGMIATEIAGDKDVTKKILQEAYAPVPAGVIVNRSEDLQDAIDEVGFPLVVKPLNSNHGKGATTDINSWQEVTAAFLKAKEYSNEVVIEKYIRGCDYRALVINYKFVAAALRTPAAVMGDGIHTIEELVNIVNKDPRRGNGHEKVLTKIQIDEATIKLLAKMNYTPKTILAKGVVVHLKDTANLSTGGTSTDVTDLVHPSNIRLFERVARIIGLDICGIDIVATSLSTPVKKNGGAIIEINAAPGLRMHLCPSYGNPRNVAAPIIDMLFPTNDARIPIVAVTGTNGKTTTTRLIAHIAREAGFVTGFTTTDGIYIDEEQINEGDAAGPFSARVLLKDNSVEFAVLECARGGILRSGLAFDKCDVAVVTNIASDHLGLGGIQTLDQLAKVKSVVPETVKESGYAVLNADDDKVYAMKDRLSCKIALFSLQPDNPLIEEHCARGGLAAIIDNSYVCIRRGRETIRIGDITGIPVTFNGSAIFNIANVLAASLAAYCSKINVNVISQSLRSFIPSYDTMPGRMNLVQFEDFAVLLDYAHNPHALRSLGQMIGAYPATQKTGIIAGIGDRRSEDIVEFGQLAGTIFDQIIIREDKDLRGRRANEIPALLKQGIGKSNGHMPVMIIPDECEALDHAISNAISGSLIVILSDNIEDVNKRLNYYLLLDKEKNKVT